ncbi:MAG: hypothetical protein ACI4KF_02525 [Huintestinicola sp.]
MLFTGIDAIKCIRSLRTFLPDAIDVDATPKLSDLFKGIRSIIAFPYLKRRSAPSILIAA